MKRVDVSAGERSYGIFIDNGLISKAGEYIAGLKKRQKVAVVSDENVWSIHGKVLKESLTESGIECAEIVLPAGEGTKSAVYLEKLWDEFAEMKIKRDGLAIAFGGGVIGDLCGFASATYMRGIDYVQMPTTILSQVDSSVGGKTAINIKGGKNLAGAFYQPKMVLIDTSLLKSLSDRDYSGGMAEVIKHGMIFSRELIEILRNNAKDRRISEDVIVDVIYRNCGLKADTVSRDEFEHGERMLLNFGHTFGHAIEKLGNFTKYTHGEAVALGMVIAVKTGMALGLTAGGTLETLEQLLELYGLKNDAGLDIYDILPLMGLDKKNTEKGMNLILLKEPASPVIHPATLDDLTEISSKLS